MTAMPSDPTRALAALLLDLDDDVAFLELLERAWDVLLGIAPWEALALLDLVGERTDLALSHAPR